MLINFKSTIKNDSDTNVIDFTSKVQVSKFQDFDVYEFLEPSKGEMNRIEVSTDKVNIMAGPSTIELELNNVVEILYALPTGQQLPLRTYLKEINNEGDFISFSYTLSNSKQEIGFYNIELKIK